MSWGYTVQIQINYINIATGDSIFSTTPSDFNCTVEGSYPGIKSPTVIDATDNLTGHSGITQLNYTIIQFQATPTVMQTIEYNFTICKINYQPITYTVAFNIVPVPTKISENFLGTRYWYNETIDWQFQFLDNSNSSAPFAIGNNYLFTGFQVCLFLQGDQTPFIPINRGCMILEMG